MGIKKLICKFLLDEPRKILPTSMILIFLGASWGSLASSASNDESQNDKISSRDLKLGDEVSLKTYQNECTSCHVGYLPGFLPGRSWSKIVSGLDHHFGENASVDEQTRDEILGYLLRHSADSHGSTARSKKITNMIAKDETPIRITETPFWIRKHSAIKKYVWKRTMIGSKAKCESCHREADKGVFDDSLVEIPKADSWF